MACYSAWAQGFEFLEMKMREHIGYVVIATGNINSAHNEITHHACPGEAPKQPISCGNHRVPCHDIMFGLLLVFVFMCLLCVFPRGCGWSCLSVHAGNHQLTPTHQRQIISFLPVVTRYLLRLTSAFFFTTSPHLPTEEHISFYFLRSSSIRTCTFCLFLVIKLLFHTLHFLSDWI